MKNWFFAEMDPLHLIDSEPFSKGDLNYLSKQAGFTAIAVLRKTGISVQELNELLERPLQLASHPLNAEQLALALSNAVFCAYSTDNQDFDFVGEAANDSKYK